MRTLSSVFLLALMLGSCGLKAPIYIPKDRSLCLGCSKDPLFKADKKEKSKLEGQEEPLDKERFKYIPKEKGQKN